MNKFSKFFLLSCVFLSSHVMADVLMLDMNFSEKEVIAAREAAKIRGEAFHIFPEVSSEDRRKISKLMKRKTYFHRAWLKAYDRGEHWDPPAEVEEVDNHLQEYKYKYGVDKHSFNMYLKDKVGDNKISSLIVSGHSDGDAYFGALGAINFDDLEKILMKNKQKKSLESVYLWGCFTGTPGAMLRWREAYKELNIVAGFDGRSPSGDLKNSYELLKKLMIKEAKISEETEIKALSRAVRSVNYEYITGLTYLKGECYVDGLRKKNIANIFNLPTDCKGRVTFLLTKQKDQFVPYRNGEKPLPNPDSGNTPLRHFYDNLQSSFHCLDHCKSSEQRETMKSGFETDQDAHNYDEKKLPCPGEVIRLVKFDHIIHNMNIYYKSGIDLFKGIVETDADLNSETCTAVFNQSGKNVRANIENNIDNFISCMEVTLSTYTFSVQDTQEIKKMARGVYNTLLETNRCVPLSWIDEQVKPEAPHC